MPQERLLRIDAENRLGLDFHAPRTLRRFEGDTNPEARRAAVTEGKFRNEGAYGREADAMRKRLLQMLDRIEGKLTPEQLKLQEIVRAQFEGELAVHREFGLYDAKRRKKGDVAAPDVETASQALLTQLTPEQVAEILKQAKQPQFQLEAVISFERYVAALDGHKKMSRQIDTYVDSDRRKAWAAQDAAAGIGDKIVGWNIGIIEGAQELEAGTGLSGNLGQKCTQAETKLSAAGLRLPNHRRYALAQMRAIKTGKPLDVVNWSVFNDDTDDNSVVPGGYWDDNLVYFDENLPAYLFDLARFRPEVVAKVA